MSGEPVFVTGGTGYLGSALIETLLSRGHPVHALARRGSETRLPQGARASVGDALDAETFAAAIPARASTWYVLGPGHRWPVVLAPLYALLRMIPATRESAQRLGLVTRAQVIATLVHAVATPPPSGIRIVEVPEMRRAGS